MAITGNNDGIYKASLSMDAKSYNEVVGDVQGKTVGNKNDYGNLDGWGGEYRSKDYDAGTVAGKYVLKGKAGITNNFYKAFSDAFDQYKAVIKKDLDDLETNPDIHQAFSGTEIEKAVKNLIVAVEAEANDYLFKLEQAEKTVINSVQNAFRKQQEKMAGSMNTDTSKLAEGNSTELQRKTFASTDVNWGGTPDGSGTSGGNAGARTNPSVVRNLTY